MAPLAVLFVGSAATGSAGLIGSAGAVTASGLALAAGAGLATAGQLQQGRMASAQGSFEKKIAIRNQQALERQAKAEREAASIEADRAARREKIVMGAQRAQAGKSGGQIAGSTLDFLADTARQFSIQRNLILRGGMIRGQELTELGQTKKAEGRWAATLGKQAKQLSYIKAGGTVLMARGSIK